MTPHSDKSNYERLKSVTAQARSNDIQPFNRNTWFADALADEQSEIKQVQWPEEDAMLN